jgi:hypothetical protein
MSNAKKFIPAPGAFTLAAKTLGVTPQAVSQAWHRGKREKVMTAVINASILIVDQKLDERREYAAAMRRAAWLAREVNQAAEAVINETI